MNQAPNLVSQRVNLSVCPELWHLNKSWCFVIDNRLKVKGITLSFRLKQACQILEIYVSVRMLGTTGSMSLDPPLFPLQYTMWQWKKQEKIMCSTFLPCKRQSCVCILNSWKAFHPCGKILHCNWAVWRWGTWKGTDSTTGVLLTEYLFFCSYWISCKYYSNSSSLFMWHFFYYISFFVQYLEEVILLHSFG